MSEYGSKHYKSQKIIDVGCKTEDKWTSCAEGQITTSVGSLLGGDVTFPCLDHQDGTISFGGIENNFFLQV